MAFYKERIMENVSISFQKIEQYTIYKYLIHKILDGLNHLRILIY